MSIYNKFSIILLTVLLYSCSTFGQNKMTNRLEKNTEYSAAFYNVENLFDTINNQLTNDEDFLPEGSNKWNSERYSEKIQHINYVISLLENPLFIGMVEIENANVVRDVINYSPENKSKFGLVHYDSPDERGIDVALIYDSLRMKLIETGKISFDIPREDGSIDKTRDILWAKFLIGKVYIYAFVNHWPSRSGGQEQSDKSRVLAATKAKEKIDEILRVDDDANIIFMGDLNDYPENNAPMLIAEKLTPMISKSSGEFGGTYSYKGVYDVLDHILVSEHFLKNKSLKVVENSGEILSPEILIETYKGDKVPFRTYAGSKYLGGYSDHLPVQIKFVVK